MKYIEDLSQEKNILSLLKERGSYGVYVYEMQAPRPVGLGVAQYNARIKGLRKKGHVIKNTTPGHFVLLDGSQPQPEKIQASTVTTRSRRKRQPVALRYDASLMYYDKETNTHKWK